MPAPSLSLRGRIAGWGFLVLLLATLLRVYVLEPLSIPYAWVVPVLAMAVPLLLALPEMPWAGRGFVLAPMALSLLLLTQQGRAADLVDAAMVPSMFGGLFVALTFMRMAAQQSPAMKRGGEHLLTQPPGRRYAALTFGGNVFTLVLGFGMIMLMGTMARQGNTLQAAGGDPQIQEIRERRTTVALIRAFCGAMTWSPIAVPMAVVTTSIQGLSWQMLLPIAFATNLMILVLGWVFDRLGPWQGIKPPAVPRPDISWRVHATLITVILTVFGGAVALEAWRGVPLVMGVAAVLPVVALVWMGVQAWPARASTSPLATVAKRSLEHVRGLGVSHGLELAVLCGAVMSGRLMVLLLDGAGTGLEIFAAVHPAVLVGGIMAVIMLACQIGLNPMATAAVLVGLIPDPAVYGIHPVVMGIAVLGSWTLSIGVSPLAITVILAGRLIGKSARLVGYGWNGSYTLGALAMLSVWLVVLALMLPISPP